MLGTMTSPESTPAPTADPPHPDVLVLGGTSWLGGAVARRARDDGHRVTCLARGEAGEAPEGVTWVRADRAQPTAYDEVAGRPWDVVVDVSWQPDLVRGALAALAPTTDHWVYVSSCSVYVDDATPDTGEEAALHEPFTGPGPADWDVYGPAKVACERACTEAMGADRVLLARAGLIGGYGDRSDRLGYWPARMARAHDGEAVLVPPLDAPAQVVDVQDLALWLVRSGVQRRSGALNALGDVVTVGTYVRAAAEAAGVRPRLVEVSHEWLAEQQVEPWMGPESLPLWLPLPEYAGFMTRRNDAARAAGLTLRPVVDTVADSLRWEREQGLDRDRRAGLTPDRESALLTRT
jgi:2'-hydroxyisoflavone reductase